MPFACARCAEPMCEAHVIRRAVKKFLDGGLASSEFRYCVAFLCMIKIYRRCEATSRASLFIELNSFPSQFLTNRLVQKGQSGQPPGVIRRLGKTPKAPIDLDRGASKTSIVDEILVLTAAPPEQMCCCARCEGMWGAFELRFLPRGENSAAY